MNAPAVAVAASPTLLDAGRRLRRPGWWLDLAGMLAAMFVGMGVGHLVEMAAGTPATSLRLLSMGLWMSLGMTVWMFVRRFSAGHLVEMNLAMMVPFGLAAVGYAAGLLGEDAAMSLGHLVMLIAMVAVHLFRPACRRDSTAGRHGG